MRKLLFIFAASILGMVACNDKESQEFDQRINKSISNSFPTDDELKYDSVLIALHYGLIDLSTSEPFKNLVHQKCAEEFDGDNNVLIKKLDQNWPTLKNDLTNSIIQHAPNHNPLLKYIDLAVDGFDYFGEQRFAQIYIPDFEDQNLSTNSAIALNLNDSAILPGHKLVNNNLITIDVNQTYAEQNLCWVVSCNEIILSNADYNNMHNLNVQIAEEYSWTEPDTTVVTPNENGERIIRNIDNRTNRENYKKTRSVTVNLRAIKIPIKNRNWGRIKFSHIGRRWNCNNEFSTTHLKTVMRIKKNQLNTWLTIPQTGSQEDNYMENQNYWALFYDSYNRKKFEKSITILPFDLLSGSPNCSITSYFISRHPAIGDCRMHWAWWSHRYGNIIWPNKRTIEINMNSSNTWLRLEIWR